MSRPRQSLTVTSYAILGQLALRPWTTYELAAEMRRNFRYFWPRAESAVYAEIKRLAVDGLVRGERTYVGRRGRTTYEITAAGEEALRTWLGTAPANYVLEFEGLLRVFFARFGTVPELQTALGRTREQAEELLRVADAIAREYHEGRAPFQEQIEVRALVHAFLASFGQTVRDWVEQAESEVASWDALTLEERRERGQRYFDAAVNFPRSGALGAIDESPESVQPSGCSDSVRSISTQTRSSGDSPGTA
jgi:PadR family transcriptional regulator, regulatory protein AphA